jgi:hypothetical protein
MSTLLIHRKLANTCRVPRAQAGQYIKAVLVDEGGMWPRMGLYVQGVADPGQREQVEQLLPLCEHVLVVKRFVETRSHTHMRLVTQVRAGRRCTVGSRDG